MPVRQSHRSASPFEDSVGFCRAVRVGERIEVAGTAPIGPDGKTVAGDAGDQASRCFAVIGEALERLGGDLRDVTRTRIYITDVADWEAIAAAHGEVFRDIRPASTMVVVAGLLDPAWRVEIEADAHVGARPEASSS